MLLLYCFCIDIYCLKDNHITAFYAMKKPMQDRTIRESIFADVASQFYEIRQPRSGESLLSEEDTYILLSETDTKAKNILASVKSDIQHRDYIDLTKNYIEKYNIGQLHEKMNHYFMLLKTIKDVGDFSQERHSTGTSSALDILLDSKVLNLKNFVNYEGERSTPSPSTTPPDLTGEIIQNMSHTMNITKETASNLMKQKWQERSSDFSALTANIPDLFPKTGWMQIGGFTTTYDALHGLLKNYTDQHQLYCYYLFNNISTEESSNPHDRAENLRKRIKSFQESFPGKNEAVILFIPIHLGNHYISVFVDLKNKKIVLINSYDGVYSDTIKHIFKYFTSEDDFSHVVIPMKQQKDGWACGYFTIFYSLCIMLNGLKEGINRAHEILNKKTMSKAGDIEEWIKLIKGETSGDSSSDNLSSIENFQLAVVNKVFQQALQEFIEKY